MNHIFPNEQSSDELYLRRKIGDFYLPRQLVNAIVETGSILTRSEETFVGIGFLDISKYTFLSRLLSPLENQTVLNGLYSAFQWVISKHEGYLNKIEGDSLMFHYGGPIDPIVKKLGSDEAVKLIARELFYTCVELQRICGLFNDLNTNFLNKVSDKSTVDAIRQAYRILADLRSGSASASFNALFQIRVRVGASFGKVLVGNFGPDGAKQWDVIGVPVIEAKRMESSAPIGGVRITENFFNILHESGVTSEFHSRIRREAQALGSVYQNITFDELFQRAGVCLKDKKNAQFKSYSIQVNPALPESIIRQSRLLLTRSVSGADDIVDFIKYYRGNHFVIDQFERLFELKKVRIRKKRLVRVLLHCPLEAGIHEKGCDEEPAAEKINEESSLFELLSMLGRIQDSVNHRPVSTPGDEQEFHGYDSWMTDMHKCIHQNYTQSRTAAQKAYFFYNVIFPLFFENIKASILEYQETFHEVEEL